jgi:DNA-binding beta-propeller fold protein YncE
VAWQLRAVGGLRLSGLWAWPGGISIVGVMAGIGLMIQGVGGGADADDPAMSLFKRHRRVVWVALEDGQKVAKVDVSQRRVLRRLGVPGRPHNITVSDNGKLVAAALWDAARIAIVRDGSVKNVYLGGAPHDLKMTRRLIVVANQGAARLDVVGKRGRRRGRIGLSHDPHDLAITPGGKRAIVTLEGTGRMAVVDIATRRVRRYKRTWRAPHDLLFAPDGRLWVTDWQGAIHVFKRSLKRIKTIRLGEEAHHLDFTPNGREVWITDHGAHRVFVLSTRTFRVVKRLRIKGAPHHVAITSDGDRAVVADHDRGLVVVYNTAKRTRSFKMRVGRGPHGVWAAP